MYTSSFLTDVRKRAIHGKVWFKALDGLERGILSLSAKVLDVVHSVSLEVEIAKIINKIEEALRGVFERRLLGYGFGRAKEIVAHAVKLGCVSALNWMFDSSFARYVTFMSLNAPVGWSF